MKTGRNDPCPCGSGQKFKKCCGDNQTRSPIAPTNDAEAQFNLASALHSQGDLAAAVVGYRRALRLKPDFADAHNDLGNALMELGHIDEALTCFHRALALRPRFAAAWGNLGNALFALGRAQDAVHPYRQMLEIDPDSAQGHNNLGNILRSLGAPREAAAHCRCALTLRPNFADAYRYLGNALFDLGQFDDAAANYAEALAIAPDYAQVHTALCVVLRQMGRAVEAEASCRRALSINPLLPEALVLLGEIQGDSGQFSEAEALFKQAIAIEPDLPDAWTAIVRYRKMNADDGCWRAAAERLVSRQLPIQNEIDLRFAMGKYFDDLKEFDRAFDNYKAANELTRRYGVKHDRERLSQRVDRIIASYNQDWLMRVRGESNLSERPVFIVGMPRAGTSLAEQILASHPRVAGAGELRFWHAGRAAYETSQLEGNGAGVLATLAREYLQQLQGVSPDAARVVDKMPANTMNLGLIHAALPGARVIHLHRHPVDTCLSAYFQAFSTIHSYANTLEDLAHFYLQYFRLMQHWQATLPEGAILNVPYEALVEEPERWSRRMVEFAGLEWDPRCLEFHRTDRMVLTASSWQVRQEINKSSVGRWRNYEKFVASLRELMELEFA